MRKIFIFFALAASTITFAETIKRGDLYYSLSTSTATVVQDQNKIDGKNYSTLDTIVIPSTITYSDKTYTVTAIGSHAFSYATTLLSVTLPATITTISEYAFDYCDGLTSLELPEALNTIGNYALRGCVRIDSLVIPKYVTSIGSVAFSGCTGLKHVVWKAVNCGSVSAYNNRPFYNCDNIETFIFGDEVQKVPAFLCYNMTKLTEIVLPNTVTSIGSSAFYHCTSLESLTLPEKLTVIPGSMCAGCTALPHIAIPATVATISEYAFDYCDGLTSLVLPESLNTIGNYALRGCVRIDSLVIPKYVTSIGSVAFSGCTGLKHVVWKAVNCGSVSAYNNRPFYNCDNIETFIFGDEVQKVPNYLCYNMTKLTEIVLPNTVTTIGSSAFYYCTSLESLTLPEKLTVIPGSMCAWCTSLLSIDIPKGVTEIANYAFDGCSQMQSAIIPSTVSTIGNYAFRDCSLLATLYNYAFTPQTINENVFNNVDKSTCFLYVPEESLDLYEGKAVWNSFANIIGVDPGLVLKDTTTTITYLGQAETDTIHTAPLLLTMPVAPKIEGFIFLKWEVLAGDFADGITLQAVYEAAPSTDINEAQTKAKAAKLLRRGNVFILRGDKTYTITGQQIK